MILSIYILPIVDVNMFVVLLQNELNLLHGIVNLKIVSNLFSFFKQSPLPPSIVSCGPSVVPVISIFNKFLAFVVVSLVSFETYNNVILCTEYCYYIPFAYNSTRR